MMTFLSSVFFFIIALGILITFHEFGHYWVARKCGVKVLRFSVGFGKPFLRWQPKGHETEFVLAAIPLGGYVRMVDEREGPVPEEDVPRAFNRQSLGARTAIVAAGPIFNFLLAIFFYWLIFIVGVTGVKPIISDVIDNTPAQEAGFNPGDRIVAIDDTEVTTLEDVTLVLIDKGLTQDFAHIRVIDELNRERVKRLDLSTLPQHMDNRSLYRGLGFMLGPRIKPIVNEVIKDRPAYFAGFKSGDEVIMADDEVINDWESWVKYVMVRPNQAIEVLVLRDGQETWLTVTPELDEKSGRGLIGVSVFIDQSMYDEWQAVKHYSVFEALVAGAQKTWDMSILTLRVLGKIVVGDLSTSNLSGPISIAKFAGFTAAEGLVSFLGFLAIVSVSLGVINLLPIPMLDGGHLLYYFVEFVTRRPVSEEVLAIGQRIGIALLLTVMLLAIYNDIIHL